MRAIIAAAIEDLCSSFARQGYNPTPIIDLGILVAMADGMLDESERSMLREIFQALLETSLSAEVVDHLITSSLDVMKAAGAENRARLVGAILQDCDAVEPGILVALGVAFASEGLSAAERTVVDRIAKAAGLPMARLNELIDHARPKVDADPVSVRRSLAPGA